MDLHGGDGELGRAHQRARRVVRVLAQVGSHAAQRLLLAAIAIGRHREAPALHPLGDRDLAVVVGIDTGRPGTPGSRRCDRSAAGARRSSTRRRRASGSGRARRSRGATWPAGSRGAGNSSGGDVGQRVGLVGPDVDELRRRAARRAAVARHVGIPLAAQRRFHLGQPRREAAGAQRRRSPGPRSWRRPGPHPVSRERRPGRTPEGRRPSRP